jgi:hypothetical protein
MREHYGGSRGRRQPKVSIVSKVSKALEATMKKIHEACGR